jgi:hypothetical protein
MKTFNQKLAEREAANAIPRNDAEHLAVDKERLASWSDKMLLDAMRVAIDDAVKLSGLGHDLVHKIRHNTVDEIEKRLNIRKKPMRFAGEWAEFFCKPEDSEQYRATVVAWVQRIQDDALNRNAPPLNFAEAS